MSNVIDIKKALEERNRDASIAESGEIAQLQHFPEAPPLATAGEVRALVGDPFTSEELAKVFDYHRETVLGFTARNGLESRTQRIFEESLADTTPFLQDDTGNPIPSYLDVAETEPKSKEWIHRGVITLSDINRYAGEIVFGYRRTFPRRKSHPYSAADIVLRSAYAGVAYELFAKSLNAAAMQANKFGTYRHGINMHSIHMDEGTQQLLVGERLRKLKRFELRDHEGERLIRGFGHLGLTAELERTELVTEIEAGEITRYINAYWRERLPEGCGIEGAENWLIGYSYPYHVDDIIQTLKAFRSIEQPRLIEDNFKDTLEQAFTPSHGLRLVTDAD